MDWRIKKHCCFCFAFFVSEQVQVCANHLSYECLPGTTHFTQPKYLLHHCAVFSFGYAFFVFIGPVMLLVGRSNILVQSLMSRAFYQSQSLSWDFSKAKVFFMIIYGKYEIVPKNSTYLASWHFPTIPSKLVILPFLFRVWAYFVHNFLSLLFR